MNFMKSVLIGLLISSQAFAGLPPTTTKGQNDASPKVTFNLHAPESQMTRINGTTALIETGNRNVLANPGFEGGTAAWAITGGGATLSTVTAGQATGKQSALWSTPAQNSVLYSGWQTVSAGDGFSGQNGVVSCRFKCASGNCTHTFEAWGGVLTDLSPITPITSSTTQYVRSTANFIYPVSGVVRIHVNAVAVAEPNLLVDDCYMGLAEGFNLTQATGLAGGPPVAYTPAFGAGCGSPTSINIYSQRVGNNLHVTGSFIMGAVAASFCSFGLPPNLNIDTSVITQANTVFSAGVKVGTIAQEVANAFGHIVTATGTSTTQVYATPIITQLNVLNSLSTFNSFYYGATYTSIDFTVPIQGWAAQVNGLNVLTDNTASSWNGYVEGTTFTSTSAPYVDGTPVGGLSVLTTLSNVNFGPVSIYGSGNGITFTPKKLGTYQVCAHTSVGNSSSGNGTALRLFDGTNEIGGGIFQYYSGGVGDPLTTSICGHYVALNVTPASIRIQIRTSAGSGGQFSGGNGRTQWTIFQLDGAQNVPYFVGSVTSTTTGQERIERAKIAVTPVASTVVSSSSNWITPSRLGPGQTAGTISGFSGAPSCTCTVDDPGANADTICLFYVSTTATHLEFSTYSPVASARTNNTVNLICMGPH